jgi:3D (Asp-Asp-Asp) domain-containing protein
MIMLFITMANLNSAPIEVPPEPPKTYVVEATAYCTCSKCTPGKGITASGTVPKENHTVAADWSVFPKGTKLEYDGIVYTVEDTGSAIKGDKIDIYFKTHKEALNFGRKDIEVTER